VWLKPKVNEAGMEFDVLDWSNFVLVRAFARQLSLLLQGRSQPIDL